MANPIKPKRGTEATRTTQTPLAGELTITTDQLRVFVGDGTTAGGKEVAYDAKGSASGVQSNLTAHINDTVDAHDASAISNVPAGNVTSTNMQAAVDELDAEKAGITLANTFTKRQTLPDAVLSAVDLALGSSTAYVDAIIYDTSKDSDGGAWRERCSHLSWYTEARPSGRFLGRYADRASAIAANPDWTVNDWYARTGTTTFWQLTPTAETQIYRGGKAKFPARSLVVAETTQVVIYDLDESQVSMWMVLGQTNRTDGKDVWRGGRDTTAIAVANSTVLFGVSLPNAPTQNGLVIANFASDSYGRYGIAGWSGMAGPIAQDNPVNTTYLPVLPNVYINDVSITTLPNASSEAETFLPKPLIAAATDGNSTYSVSVIIDDGTVVNVGADDATRRMLKVSFSGSDLYAVRDDGLVYVWRNAGSLTTGKAPDATYSASSTPAILGTAGVVA